MNENHPAILEGIFYNKCKYHIFPPWNLILLLMYLDCIALAQTDVVSNREAISLVKHFASFMVKKVEAFKFIVKWVE